MAATAWQGISTDLRNTENTEKNTNLTESGVVKRKDNTQHQVCVSSPRILETNCPEPCKEQDTRSDDVPWNFDHDLGGDEGSPAVHATGTFANLIDFSGIDERDLKLICQRNTTEEKLERERKEKKTKKYLRIVAMKIDYMKKALDS